MRIRTMDMELPPGITIRPASYGDAWALTRLKKTIEQEAPHLALGKEERRETAFHALVRMFVNRKRSMALVATDRGDVVGHTTVIFAKFRKLRGNAYLTIAVRNSYRGKGIGSALMHAAHEAARKHGARRMELEVFAKNAGAIALYERLGYEREGMKKNAVEDAGGFDDIVFMAKPLA